MKNNFSITFVITGQFDSFHRKSLILSIANYIKPNPVIIIDRPFDFVTSPLKNPKRFFVKKITILDNVYILKSKILIHDKLTLHLTKNFKKIVFFPLKKDFMKLKSMLQNENNILWIMHPELIDYIDILKPSHIIYDCYDDFLSKSQQITKNLEKELVNLSSLVITSSEYLKKSKTKMYGFEDKYLHSPTAIDPIKFKIKVLDIPEDIKKINKPIIGFAGSIRDDLDLEIIKFLADNLKDCSIVFVGTVFAKNIFDELKNYKNVYFLGTKSFDEFVKYLNFFDVAIMPHILNEFINSSSPYKLYQYLASSLYTVSSSIPEVIDFEKTKLGQKLVKVAYNKEEFLEKVVYFLNKSKITLTDEELYSISWENRFDTLFSELKKRNII